MALSLFAHPFSSYCQKVLVALYENATPFTFRLLDQGDPATFAEFAALWQLRRFPLLRDGDRPIAEATIIVEHLDLHHPGPVRLIPADRAAALEVRFLDRFFDNYVQTPMQKIVLDAMRGEGEHDPRGVAEARALLDQAYGWLERHLAVRRWAAGEFGLAGCAAALPCSTPTGSIRSARGSRRCAPTGRGSMPGPRSRGRSTRRGPIAPSSRSARRIATERIPAQAALYSPVAAWDIARHAHPP